ncbi:MAG: PspA/IM30 family protein [Gammaproteobacteria bacterium]|nr:PspA/IM30 family protein [Gammaproteobacteria bacterium]
MRESITSRVGRIVSGSLNAMVDAIENAVPETVMEEAIREIDGVIDDVRAELGLVIAKKHLASTRLMDESSKHDDLSEKIELAVKENRDDLAEAAIASQLDIEAQIPVLENTIAECGTQEKDLDGYISALQAKKREMKEDLKIYVAAHKEAQSIDSSSTTSGSSAEKRTSKATESFDRVMENATGVASRLNSNTGKTAAQLSELDELARKNRIQERLASIKKQ